MSMKWGRWLAAGLAAATGVAAGGAEPYSYVCEEIINDQMRASFGKRFAHDVERRQQIYKVDPNRREVTRLYAEDQDGLWIERPTTIANAIFTPGGRVVACPGIEGVCLAPKSFSDSGKTVTFKTGQIILNPPKGTSTSWTEMHSRGNDGSWINGRTSVAGTCKKEA